MALFRSLNSLLMLAGWAVDTAGTVSAGTTPDAFVAAGAVAMLARRRVDAAFLILIVDFMITFLFSFTTHT